MKKIFIVSFMLLFAFMVSAQNGGGRLSEAEMEKRYEEMKKELSLDAKQLENIKAIDKEFSDKIRENGRGDRDAMRAMSEKRTEQVKAILTDEQFTKYQEMQRQWRQQRGPRGG